jgi:hypothetical protein
MFLFEVLVYQRLSELVAHTSRTKWCLFASACDDSAIRGIPPRQLLSKAPAKLVNAVTMTKQDGTQQDEVTRECSNNLGRSTTESCDGVPISASPDQRMAGFSPPEISMMLRLQVRDSAGIHRAVGRTPKSVRSEETGTDE